MELRDILDEHGNKTGKTGERGKSLNQGEYYLIVDVWIMNNNGEFLISKRTNEPEANKWQPTSGCAVAGEDSISAALRETKEEIGITLNPQNGKMVKRYIAWADAIVDVWLFKQEVDINEVVLQPRETDDIMWATSDAINQLFDNDKFLQRVPYLNELFQICEL
jgi:8-oxo-dGTP pyrophosphatase MutT (NUDIX family)